MKMFHRRRLIKLANFLESLPDEKFNIASWQSIGTCGTVACAVGWACEMPDFKKAGLTYDGFAPCFKPVYKQDGKEMSFNGFGAARLFFGISGLEARSLFSDSGYNICDKITQKMVAQKIRDFVASKSSNTKV